MSSSSEGTVPTPSSNEGMYASPSAVLNQTRADNTLSGSPEEEAAFKEFMDGTVNVKNGDESTQVEPEAEADDEVWLLQLLWPK